MPVNRPSLFLPTVFIGLALADLHLASLAEQPIAQLEQTPVPHQTEPFLIGLRRESVPIYRHGKIASFKTSYSGVLHVGTPAQEFRVVFDTGSGNVVLPAVECKSEACLVEDRRRFNMTASSTAEAINEDGSPVRPGQASDQVTIGFGTGEITGEFSRDRVCFGTPPKEIVESVADQGVASTEANGLAHLTPVSPSAALGTELCVEMGVILAVEMSTQPFKTFRFDGILGLGLGGLAMSRYFSAFEMIMGTGLQAGHFGVFLSEGEDGEESEIAMGGMDPKRLLEPLSWAPVAMPELGYWQIPILAVRVNGQLLDVCRDGTCRGVVDTGTSHLGVPAPYDKEMSELLIRDAGETLDCRLIIGAEVEIELPGYNLTLHPANYMRRLPLREGVSVSSAQGVYVPSSETNATLSAPSSADPVAAPGSAEHGTNKEVNSIVISSGNSSAMPASGDIASGAKNFTDEGPIRRFCSPRLMPVRLPEPLGPKLFILGEPVLHRYYTVYDWLNHRVGFSLANTRQNTVDPSEITDRRGVLPKEVDMLLMQERVVVAREMGSRRAEVQDEVAMVQITLKLAVRTMRQ
jgi:hypothetical protein